MTPFIFACCTGIKQGYAAVSRKLIRVFNMPLLHNTARDVVDHKASHIHGILCRRIRRRIGEVKLLKLCCPHTCTNCGCKHVNAFVYAIITYDLCTEELIRVLFKDDLHRHYHPTGIIACVAHGRKNNGIGLIAQAPRFLFTHTGCSGSQVKDLENATSL